MTDTIIASTTFDRNVEVLNQWTKEATGGFLTFAATDQLNRWPSRCHVVRADGEPFGLDSPHFTGDAPTVISGIWSNLYFPISRKLDNRFTTVQTDLVTLLRFAIRELDRLGATEEAQLVYGYLLTFETSRNLLWAL